MMMVLMAVIVALCATILYVDGKMIDAQDDYIIALHECIEDQAKEIKALWLMSDYFHNRIEVGGK